MRHFLTLLDLTPDEVRSLLEETASKLKDGTAPAGERPALAAGGPGAGPDL